MWNPILLDNIQRDGDEGHKLLEAIDDFIAMSVQLELAVQSPDKINLEGIYP